MNGQLREAAEKTNRPIRREIKNGEARTARRSTAADGMEAEKPHKCRNERTKAINHWFGESLEEETGTDSDSDNLENNWNTIDREGKNLERKRRTKERRTKKMAEIARKARCMAGLGLISDLEIEMQYKITNDYEKAKKWAVKSHLAKQYSYNQEELDTINIIETKRTHKYNIVYVVVENERDIRDMYYRKAECKNDKTTIKNFIPPQYHERFLALNKICTARRAEDDYLKTQIRFGEKDLIILTKEKGSDSPFKAEDLLNFIGDHELPAFDMSIKWRIQADRPPRRRIATLESPASGQSEKDSQSQAGQSGLRRLDSVTNEEATRKKCKTVDSPPRRNEDVDTQATRNEDADMTL